ncbi:hypothetical protein J6590_101774, partial [Homalodisca vitripennis]
MQCVTNIIKLIACLAQVDQYGISLKNFWEIGKVAELASRALRRLNRTELRP